jgi:eukaryotic translation initiation factor 2C
MIVKPGPVIDFLLANQKVDHPDRIDWPKVSGIYSVLDNIA